MPFIQQNLAITKFHYTKNIVATLLLHVTSPLYLKLHYRNYRKFVAKPKYIWLFIVHCKTKETRRCSLFDTKPKTITMSHNHCNVARYKTKKLDVVLHNWNLMELFNNNIMEFDNGNKSQKHKFWNHALLQCQNYNFPFNCRIQFVYTSKFIIYTHVKWIGICIKTCKEDK